MIRIISKTIIKTTRMSKVESEVQLDDEKLVGIVENNRDNTLPAKKLEIKVYKRRWLILILKTYFVSLISGQWVQYSIISNVVSEYYGVSTVAVDSTATVFMVFCMVFMFPLTYLGERIGLRRTVILGSFLCCLGSWIKTFSVTPNGFYITFIGQTIVALSAVMVIPLAVRVSASWFGSNELSTATTIGIIIPQFGLAATFLLTPVFVKTHDNIDEIAHDLYCMFRFFAIATSINLLLCVLFFQDEPKLPPSETRALQKIKQSKQKSEFFGPMKRIFTNKSFLVLCNCYGLNVGSFDAINTLMNQLIMKHFVDGEEDAGRIGMMITFTGMFSSVILGMILDKTHKFKETTVIVYFCTFCGEVAFAIAIFMEIKWMIYVSAIFLGFFMSGYLAIGFEMASEFTYPESEAYSAGILNAFNNIYGTALVFILGIIIEEYGDIPVHIILCLALLLGTIMSALTKDVKRRQDARKAASYQDVPADNITNKDTLV